MMCRIEEMVRIALERVKLGAGEKRCTMVGLRGVGKTVLLDRLRMDAEAGGFENLRIKAPEDRSLPACGSGCVWPCCACSQ